MKGGKYMHPYVTHPYYPKKVAEQLALLSNKIHSDICFGRNDSTFESFILTFFLTRTERELNEIWDETEKVNMDEVHVYFFKEREDSCPSVLSKEEMANFNFSTTSWKISRAGATGWDELREVPIGVLHITFKG